MRVGIDFGTTHTVVAVVDRGNYPVVSFDGVDTWPSIIAANEGGELRFGLDAAAVRHDPGWSVLRSFKRLLNDAGPTTTVDLAGRRYRLADLFAGFLAQLKSDLQHRSNVELSPGRAGRGRDQRAGQRLQRAALPDAGRLRTGRLRRGRSAQRAVGGGLRIRPPVPLDDHRQAGVRADLRPRWRDVRRVAAEDDGAVERGGLQRGHPAPRRRRLRRGDPQARSQRAPDCARCPRAPAISCSRSAQSAKKPSARTPGDSWSISPRSASRRSPARSTTSTRPVFRWWTRRLPLFPCAARPGRRRRRLVRDRGHLRGGRGRELPARRPDAAHRVRREAGQTLTAPVRRDGDRPGGLSGPGGGIRALRTSFAPLRGVSRGLRRRGRLLRPDRAQGRCAAHRGPAAVRRHPDLPRGAQHRTLPLRRVQPAARRPSRRRRDAV